MNPSAAFDLDVAAPRERDATAADGPATVRGWLHDRLERWWALLMGAPPLAA